MINNNLPSVVHAKNLAEVIEAVEKMRKQTEYLLDNAEITANDRIYVEPWKNATLQNSWQNYGGNYPDVQFRKDAQGMVQVRGLPKLGTLNATVFTFPVGYLPGKAMIFTGVDGGNAACRIDVGTDGTVKSVNAGSNQWLSLNQIRFYAEA